MSVCTDQRGDHWEVYQGKGGWRWRRTTKNGNIVDASAQGYTKKSDCLANAQCNGMTCTPKD